MPEYPRNQAEFEAQFGTEEACRSYLARLRWPGGFRCPKCGGTKAWPVGTLLECAACGRQASVIAGTIFQDTRTPLKTWFRAMWAVTGPKTGTSALALQPLLGLGSYQTAWAWLHKLRRAMVCPGRERLTGRVEVDETFVGALEEGASPDRACSLPSTRAADTSGPSAPRAQTSPQDVVVFQAVPESSG